jgi:hypothetical protein
VLTPPRAPWNSARLNLSTKSQGNSERHFAIRNLHCFRVTGLKLWIDNQNKPVSPSTILELPKGTHAFTFLIEPDRREGLRAQFEEVSESAARFQFK